MDTDTLPHFTGKCRPCGKPGNGYTSTDYRLLLEPELVMRPNPLLLLLLMIMIALYKGSDYLHSMNSQVVIRGIYLFLKFDFLLCVSSITYL